jgi:hypothetical protein
MKTIQIKWQSNYSPITSCPYYTPNPQFSWFGVKKGAYYKQVTGWHGCRETFSNEIRRKLGVNYSSGHNPDMTFKYLRILVLGKSEKGASKAKFNKGLANQNKWMKEGVRMVNILERKLGWSLTRLYKVEDKTLSGKFLSNEKIYIHALAGSAKWMRAPQLLSLYLLFIRLGRFHENTGVFTKFSDLSKLVNSLKNVPGREGQGARDVDYLKRIEKYLEAILDNRQALFFNRTLRQIHGRNDGMNGINKLVSGEADPAMKSTWLKIKRAKTKG